MEFYSCYEDDAFLIANEIFLSEVGLRRVQIGLTELTYHNLNNGQYTRVVRDVILMLHYRLEVYVACDNEWILKAKGSLGCLGDFEDVIGDSVELSELSTVMALSYIMDYGSNEGSLGCLGDFEDVIGDSVELSELSTVMALSYIMDYGSNEVSYNIHIY
uniref:Glucan endo-1,3-beta-D-glucosidase n=1 Tax=Ascaris lumbricoides TaxID=6252 RepID=A0A0M3IVU6_ASCLU